MPVVTTPQPELTAAIGGGLQAARGTTDEVATAMAEAVAPPTAAAAAAVEATQMAPEVHSGEMGASTSEPLAWSEADDIPDVAPSDPYDYPGAGATDAMGGPRPQMQFVEPETDQYEAARRRPMGVLIAGLIFVLAAIAVAVWFLLRNDEEHPVAFVDDRDHDDRSLSAADVGRTAAAGNAGAAAAAAARHADDHPRAGDGHADPGRRRPRRRPARRPRRRHRRRRPRRPPPPSQPPSTTRPRLIPSLAVSRPSRVCRWFRTRYSLRSPAP